LIGKNTIIIEISGVFGAGYHPDIFNSMTSHLRSKYKIVNQKSNIAKKIVTRYYVDNTNLVKNNKMKRDHLTDLIAKTQRNIILEKEWNELISLMKWSEIIFQNQLNQYQKEIDIVLRRGGRLQDHILFHNTRWKESDFERTRPKLLFFLKADLDTIKETYNDSHINNYGIS